MTIYYLLKTWLYSVRRGYPAATSCQSLEWHTFLEETDPQPSSKGLYGEMVANLTYLGLKSVSNNSPKPYQTSPLFYILLGFRYTPELDQLKAQLLLLHIGRPDRLESWRYSGDKTRCLGYRIGSCKILGRS